MKLRREHSEFLYLNLIGLLSIEYIALTLISFFLLLVLKCNRSWELRINKVDSNSTISLGSNLFLMIMPFFYTMRLPLILGIFTEIGNKIQKERRGVNERLSKRKQFFEDFLYSNYIISNLLELQIIDTKQTIRMSDHRYSKYIQNQLKSHRIAMLIFYITFYQFPAAIFMISSGVTLVQSNYYKVVLACSLLTSMMTSILIIVQVFAKNGR